MAKIKETKVQDITMAKIKETKAFILAIVLSCTFVSFIWPLCCLFFCLFYFGHCVVCAFVSFILAIVLSTMAKIKETKVQDNTMAKIKETKVQTTQWPNKRDKITDNTMAKIKETKAFCLFYFGHCVVCAFVSFILAIVLSVLLSLLFWPLCCLVLLSL
jgi:ABC-type transport system involved in multi-copper enzyme maturation permease subunit